MIRLQWRTGALAVGLAMALAAASPGPAAAGSSSVDLGVPPGYSTSAAAAVNAAGVVVGTATGDTGTHAVAWLPGPGGRYRMVDLGVLPGDTRSAALAISQSGLVAGYSGVSPQLTDAHPVIWRPDGTGYRIADLGLPAGYGYATARAIEPSGVIAGSAGSLGAVPAAANGIGPLGGVQPGFAHAALWRPDGGGGYAFIDLGTLPGGTPPNSVANAVSGSRVVVGGSIDSAGQMTAALWARGAGGVYTVASLGGRPGDWYSQAFDVSASGLVVGESLSPDQTTHALLWTRDPSGGYVLDELPAPSGGTGGQAFAVSDAGVVVGGAAVGAGTHHAVAWLPGGARSVPIDLGTLPGAASSVASDVSASGLVSGASGSQTVWWHAALWRLP